MKLVTRLATAAAAVAAVVLPAAPASANSLFSTCDSVNPNYAKRCVVLEFSDLGPVRGYGSVEDLNGAGTVAAYVFVQIRRCTTCDWITVIPGTRTEAANYTLTATPWRACEEGRYRAVLNWNYRNGQATGRIFSPSIPLVC